MRSTFGSLSKSAWAIGDQALFSGAGFLLNVLAARWMPAAAYGAFAFAFAAYMVLFFAHYALLVEPMLVLGSSTFEDEAQDYFRTLLRMHLALTIPCAMLFFATGWIISATGQPVLGEAFTGVAIAAPFATAAQLLRRMCYVRDTPKGGALGALLLLLITLLAMGGLRRYAEVTPLRVYGVLALASGLVSLSWLAILRIGNPLSGPFPLFRKISRHHWHQARYGLAGALLQWTPMNSPYLLLPVFIAGPAGLAASGSLRALVTLIQPALQINGALFALILPTLSAIDAARSSRARHYILMALGMSTAWMLLVVMAGDSLMQIIYARAFTAEASVRWPLALVPVLMAVAVITRAVCLSRLRVSAPLWGNAAAAVTSLTLGVWLLRAHGVAGVLWGIVCALAAQSAATAWRGLAPEAAQNA